MKKGWILAVLVALMVLAMALLLIFHDVRTYDFDGVTHGLCQHAVGTRDADGQPMDPDDLAFLEAAAYTTFKGDVGNTAHRNWDFVDAGGTVLFTLVDLGNRNLVSVRIDGASAIYQYSDGWNK